MDTKETEISEKIEKFMKAKNLEGTIVEKHFAPRTSGGIFGIFEIEERCMLGIKLTDDSKKIFHYCGKRAEEVYLFNQKGDKVTFKEGFKPYDTEETI